MVHWSTRPAGTVAAGDRTRRSVGKSHSLQTTPFASVPKTRVRPCHKGKRARIGRARVRRVSSTGNPATFEPECRFAPARSNGTWPVLHSERLSGAPAPEVPAGRRRACCDLREGARKHYARRMRRCSAKSPEALGRAEVRTQRLQARQLPCQGRTRFNSWLRLAVKERRRPPTPRRKQSQKATQGLYIVLDALSHCVVVKGKCELEFRVTPPSYRPSA